jgi:hypothetical protein
MQSAGVSNSMEHSRECPRDKGSKFGAWLWMKFSISLDAELWMSNSEASKLFELPFLREDGELDPAETVNSAE